MPELVSVIVPVFNNVPGVAETIASLRALADSSFEVIVVDDGSWQPVPRSLLPDKPSWTLLRLPRNVGTGAARNAAECASKGTILAFTDSDCTVPADWLTIIRGALANPQVMAVAGTFADYAQPNAVMWQHYLEALHYGLPGDQFVNCFNTNNFAVRRECFEKVGGFPPLTIGEDLILGYKLSKVGIKILRLEQLTVREKFRATARQYFAQQFRRSFAVMEIYLRYPEVFFLKWPVKRDALHLQLLFLCAMYGAAALLVARPSPRTALSISVCWTALLLLNLDFIGYARRKTGSAILAARIFLITVLVRNTAWLTGILALFLSRPRTVLPGLFGWLRPSLWRAASRGGQFSLDDVRTLGSTF